MTEIAPSPASRQAPGTARAGRTAVVTVTYNSAGVLPDFLASLAAQDNRDWALIVIDNDSKDATLEQVRAWEGPLHALVANDANRGFAAGMNQGIALARAGGFDSLLMINNDTLFGPDFMRELLESPYRADAGILAPMVRYADRPDHFWFAGGRFTWLRGPLQAQTIERPPAQGAAWKADFAPGCCLLMDLEVFDRVGPLDEDFFVYWEDVDFCWRCRERGVEILVLRSPTMLHKVSSLTGGEDTPFSIRMWHLNQLVFLRKHFGRLAVALQVPLIFLKILFRFLRGRDRLANTRLRWRATLEGLAAGRASGG